MPVAAIVGLQGCLGPLAQNIGGAGAANPSLLRNVAGGPIGGLQNVGTMPSQWPYSPAPRFRGSKYQTGGEGRKFGNTD